MAIKKRKKEIIIAEWKAGRFKSYYAAAKHYKLSAPTIKKIIGNIPQSNAWIVELGVKVNNMMKMLSPVERQAVEEAVKERLLKET